MPRRRRKASIQCLNCGTGMLEGDHFCRHCGQENHDLRVPFRHFAYEFFESFTHFDTKLWSTLKLIFTRPGQLTKDFVEGKRARYVKPAQFYVFVSIVFFALLTHTMDHDIESSARTLVDQGPQVSFGAMLPDSTLDAWGIDSAVRHLRIPITAPYYRREVERLTHMPDSSLVKELHDLDVATDSSTRAQLRAVLAALPTDDHLALPYSAFVNGRSMVFQNAAEEREFRDRAEHFTDAQVDSLLRTQGETPGWTTRKLFRALGAVDTKSPAGRKQLAHAGARAVSLIMFVLMPFTAVLLLWTFYSKRYYWEHLIFAIHIHTIWFLFFSVLLGIGLLLPHGLPEGVSGLVALVCFMYLLMALRRVYGKSWGSSMLRLLVMGIPYTIVAVVLMIIGLTWGLFSL